jgi:hypothetical protein
MAFVDDETTSENADAKVFSAGQGRVDVQIHFNSTHRYERNALAFVVASNSLRARVESEDAVDQKSVAMMTVLEFDAKQPGAIGHLFHGMGVGVPLIEIANEADGFGVGCIADEIDCPQGLSVMVERTHI